MVLRLQHQEIRDHIAERVSNPVVRRLVRRWYQTRGEGRVPDAARFSQAELAWCWDEVMLLRAAPDGDLVYDHYGRAIAAAAGLNLKGRRISGFKGPLGAFLRAKYRECLATGEPVYAVHRADPATADQTWERLLLPLADAQRVGHILVYSQPLEFKADLLDSILRASRDGIMHLRAERSGTGEVNDFVFSVINPAAERMAGLPGQALEDTRLAALPTNSMLHALAPLCRQVIEDGRTVSDELVDPRPGRYAVFMVNAVRTGDGVTVTLTDISSLKRQEHDLRVAIDSLENEMRERQNLQEELTRMATTDSLSGALNRRELLRRSKREVAAARRYGRPLSLLIADIDHFKRVNDTHGHAAGDVAIRAVADICRRALRETDLVARIGGEEYVVLMPETTLDRARITAERLRRTLAETPICAGAVEFRITASFGVADWGPEDATIEATLARADGALYAAKENGRNRVMTAPATPEADTPPTQAAAVAMASTARH